MGAVYIITLLMLYEVVIYKYVCTINLGTDVRLI